MGSAKVSIFAGCAVRLVRSLQTPVVGSQVPTSWHWSTAVQTTPAQRSTVVEVYSAKENSTETVSYSKEERRMRSHDMHARQERDESKSRYSQQLYWWLPWSFDAILFIRWVKVNLQAMKFSKSDK